MISSNVLAFIITYFYSGDLDEKIAWVSVQFHCECSVNQNRITAPASYEHPPSDKEANKGSNRVVLLYILMPSMNISLELPSIIYSAKLSSWGSYNID